MIGIKVRDLSWLFKDTMTFLFYGVMLLALFYGAKISVTLFSQEFPEGIYQYAAIIFISGIIWVWILMMFKPTGALFLLLALLPIGARLSEYFSVEIGDIVVTADVLAIWITGLISISLYGVRRDNFSIYFGLIIAFSVVSSLVNLSDFTPGSILDSFALTIILCGIITPFFLYFTVVSVIRDMDGAKLMVNALGFVIVFCSIFAFAQPFINGNADYYFYLRFPSVFYNPIIFANVIILLWPFTLICEPFGSNRLPKLTFAFRAIGVTLSIAALLLTGSRGEMMVCLVQIIWLSSKFTTNHQLIAGRTRYVIYFLILVVPIIGIINLDVLLETVFRRFYDLDFNEHGNSANERLLGALGGLELGFNNIFFGVGLGNFRYAYPTTSAAADGLAQLESAHNLILTLFAEEGLVGTAAWLFIIASACSRLAGVKDWLYANQASALYLVLTCSLYGYTATQLLFYGEFLHNKVGLPMVLFLVVIGLTSSLYFMKSNDNRSTHV